MNEHRSSVDMQLDALREEMAWMVAAQERLAVSQRRTRAALAGTLALAAAAVAVLFAQPAQSALSLHEVQAPFRVVGRGGATLFRVNPSGVTEFNDHSGAPLARLISTDQERGLRVLDAAGHPVGLLGTAATPNGQVRGLLTLDPDGVPTSTLGQTPIPGGVLDRGLFVYRPNGTIGPTLSHNPHLNAEGVVIADASGQNIQLAMVVDFPNNRAGLEISNVALKQQVRIGSVSDTGILQLFDGSGNVYFSQPPAP